MPDEKQIPEAWKKQEQTSKAQTDKPETAPRAAITACNACGGVVAWGIKSCPHCGKRKPAPTPPTKVGPKHLAIIVAALAFVSYLQITDRPQQSASKVEAIALNGDMRLEIMGRLYKHGKECHEVLSATRPTVDSVMVVCKHLHGVDRYLLLTDGRVLIPEPN